MANIKSKFYRLILTIAATLIVALILADKIIVENHLTTAHEKVREDLQKLESRLTFNLYNNIQVVKSLPALIAVKPSLTQEEFAIAADSVLDGHNQLRNIAAAPDLVISYMYPIKGNEKAIGVDYRTLPQQIDSVLQAKNTRDIVLAGPVTLIQGGLGIISRAPVFVKDKQGTEFFWGIVASVIDADLLYEVSGLLDDNSALEIAIRGRDGLGVTGEVFFGAPELFDQKNITSTITLPNGSWQIAAKPIAGWESLLMKSAPKRLIPSAIALALFLILFFSTKASANAATANFKFRNLLDGSPVPYALYNDKSQLTYLNDAFIQTFGYTLEDVPTLDDWWPKAYPDPKYREHVIDLWTSHIEDVQSSGAMALPVEVNIRCKDGSTRTVLASLAENHVFNTSEYPVALYDITERKQAELNLIEAEKRLLLSQSAGGIGTWETSLPSNKMIWSEVITQRLGFPDIDQPSWEDFINTIHPDDLGQVLKKTNQHLDNNDPLDVEYRIIDKSGKVRWVRSIGKAEFDQTGNPIIIRGTVQEITRQKVATEKLDRMAHYDVLTQLPNRTLLADRFQQAIAHNKRSNHQLAVCFLDLDKFKQVNDAYGHEVGDQLLQQVAIRIKDSVREEDTVSRQGGDEFALLLSEIESYSVCEQFVERLLEIISQPYLIDGINHEISASCGMTLYPLDNADLDTLLRHADHAMYQAKQSGRNRHRLFSVEHDEQISEKNQRLAEIEQALLNEEFRLYYQPKVHMQTGEVFGLEALIRWIHPEKGLIPPLKFLPVIQDSELELKVGNWVIDQALRQVEIWNNRGINLEVSVNISSHHLLSDDFVKQLNVVLANYPAVDSKSLQLEILESSALGDLEAISGIIKICQDALGVEVALDDFGTGYSSLTHLRNLSADTIKIDQSFVRDVLDDASDYSIIEGVIGLANAFNRSAIAEGVETTEHGLMLMIMGCYDAQGYGIAKPMPEDDIPEWLANYQPNQQWLNYGSKSLSIQENKVFLFKLIINYWMNCITKNIETNPENINPWPNFNEKQGVGYLWLKREKQDSLFKMETLIELEQARKECLILAESLKFKYQDGKIESARHGLDKLQAAFDKMDAILEQHEEQELSRINAT